MQKSELDRVAADVKNRRVSVVVVNHGVREVFLNNLGTCVHAIFWRICVEKFLIAIHIRRRRELRALLSRVRFSTGARTVATRVVSAEIERAARPFCCFSFFGLVCF